jgi:hypothetical protein
VNIFNTFKITTFVIQDDMPGLPTGWDVEGFSSCENNGNHPRSLDVAVIRRQVISAFDDVVRVE